MQRAVGYLVAAVALWGLWLALVGTTDPQEVVAGGAVAVLTALLAGGAPFTSRSLRILQPRRLAYALAYVPYMVWAIVKANLDVARRVVDPRLPINPGIVRVKTRLTHPVARTALANSITLTPGTLTMDVKGESGPRPLSRPQGPAPTPRQTVSSFDPSPAGPDHEYRGPLRCGHPQAEETEPPSEYLSLSYPTPCGIQTPLAGTCFL